MHCLDFEDEMLTSQSVTMEVPLFPEALEIPNWSNLLQESRSERQLGATRIKAKFLDSFPAWKEQLILYSLKLCQVSEISDEQSGIAEERKKRLILNTRACLKFGLSCFSLEDNDSRREVQNEAVLVCQWHLPLVSILSQKNGDAKCRTMAARILSNLVTGNKATSHEVRSSVPLSPSDVNSRIVNSIAETDGPEQWDGNEGEPNWVDMILFAAWKDNREAVAAVVAALHNCICSLDDDESVGDSFVHEVSSDAVLICTLLRYFISVDRIVHNHKFEEANQEDAPDCATQWVHLLIAKLSRLGSLPEMYKASGSERLSHIVPEQVVLLHCLAKEVSESLTNPDKNDAKLNPLGGEAGWDHGMRRSHTFLADIFSAIHTSFLESESNALDTKTDESDLQMMQSAGKVVLDMLGTSFGIENQAMERLRLHFGTTTTLIQEASQVLGFFVDTLSARSFGRTTRELKVSEEEHQILTSLVRLLGNLCFRCRYNQNVMRNTKVDVPKPGDKEENTDTPKYGRSALHVLLSCTSFGHACFTLREWSVVAIRNVLEDNEMNQQEVARLEAQQPMASAELMNAGVRVNMDIGGKVSIEPAS